MDTSAFKSPLTPQLSLAAAKRKRKQVFAEIGSNIETFIGIMDLLPDTSITIKTTEGHYLHKNTYSLETANIPNEKAILGRRAQDIYPPRLWHIYVEREAKVLETGVPLINHVYGFSSDGTSRLNSMSAFPLKGKSGQPVALLTMFKRTHSEGQSPNWHNKMQSSLEYINQHLGEDLKVSQLAHQSGLSESRFIRLFSAITGETPNIYICKVRVNAAKVLLETTDKLLADIAAETGFYDQSHFSKTFNRLVGLTPAKYRKQHWAI